VFKNYINNLIDAQSSLVSEEWDQSILIVKNKIESDKQIFTIGNGGSASTASHLATDLTKGLSLKLNKRVRAMSLSEHTSLLTAISNDMSFSNIFEFQLKNFANEGDLLIVISGSGNSENIIQAIKFAKQNKVFVLGLVGFDGGKIKNQLDHCIHVRINDMQIVEDIHGIFGHVILQNLNLQL
jgi:D-sedoheptulose 7-phosphate isomerase